MFISGLNQEHKMMLFFGQGNLQLSRIIIAVISTLFCSLTYAEDKEIKFGSVAMDIPVVMHKRLTPLTRYLSRTLKRPVSLKLSPDMGAAIKDTAAGTVDLAYLTPVAYLKAAEQGDVQLIAKTITNGKASFQLMIVVKENSPIKTVQQLIGKTFAFGDKKALLQRAAVMGSGIKLEQFSDYKFIGHYDNIARAVMNNDFDAGILKDTMAFRWEGKGLRILYRSPALPPYNITASKNLDAETMTALRDAFLNLDGKNPEHLKIIKALDKKYDGFAPTSDEEYNVIRELIRPFTSKK